MKKTASKAFIQSLPEQIKYHGLPVAALILIIMIIFGSVMPLWKIATHTFWGDAMINCYLVNWVHHSIWTNPFGYFDAPLFHPQENSGAFSSINLFVSALTSPLYFLGNPVLSYNATMYLSIILSGLSMYGCAFRFSKNRKGALLAAIIYSCNGDMIWHFFGHPNIVAPIFLPALILLAIRFTEHPKYWYAPLFGICLLLQFFSSWYIGFISIIGLTPVILYALIRRGKSHPKEMGLLMGLGLFTMLLVFMYSAPFRDVSTRFGNERGLTSHIEGSANLIQGYFTPSFHTERNKVFVAKLLSDRLPESPFGENSQYYGLTVYALALGHFLVLCGLSIAWRKNRIPSWYWLILIIMLTGLLLSLGPYYRSATLGQTRLPGWYFYTYIEPLQFMRAISRFSLLVVAGLGFLTAFAISNISFLNTGKPVARWILAAIASGILVLEYYPVGKTGLRPWSGEGYRMISQHSELESIGTLPITSNQFLMDCTATFPDTPTGYYGGVSNYHYLEIDDRLKSQNLTQSLALYSAMNVEGLMIYDPEKVGQVMDHPALETLEVEENNLSALFRIKTSQLDPATLEKETEFLENLTEFPPVSPEDYSPVRRPELEYIIDIGEGIDLEYETIKADEKIVRVPIQGVVTGWTDSLMVKMSLTSTGVDYKTAKLYIATNVQPVTTEERVVNGYLTSSNEMQWVRFDFSKIREHYPGERIIGIVLYLSADPYPGQKAAVEEIFFQNRLPE